jgi:alkaline phosphatase D
VHSVHVEVAGLLPERHYWYRFRAASVESAIGRTRTLPAAGAPVDTMKFAFASCQNFERGYFTAYEHMAQEDLDLIFHLGDYIYEFSLPLTDDTVPRRHPNRETFTLADYRNRYAQYHTDLDLQAAHAAFPWIVTPDDHEVLNDYAGPFPTTSREPIEVFLQRRASAYQAYYEHMPLRRLSVPKGPWARLYRQFSFGRLGSFFVLDTRQYRTKRPCGASNAALCEEALDPRATIMGAEQREWLLRGLDRSPARWNVIPQQVMMAPVDRASGSNHSFRMDAWAGYAVDRNRLMKFFAGRKPRNPVVLTGDVHSHWVNDLTANFDDPKSPAVATEFVGSSITSGGDGVDLPEGIKPVLADNPFVKFYNEQRGYVSCELTREHMRAEYRAVDYVSRQGAPRRTVGTFVVEDGRCGAQRV